MALDSKPQIHNVNSSLNGQSGITIESVKKWTVHDVADWLDSNRMGKYAKNFIGRYMHCRDQYIFL
jgi:hypothetical protein